MSVTATAAPACDSCKHFAIFRDSCGDRHRCCNHPTVAVSSQVIRGRTIGLEAGVCRHSAKDCGPTGQWYEAMP